MTYFSVTLDAKELNDSEGEEQRYDPSGIVHVFNARPVVNDLAAVRFCLRQMRVEKSLHYKPLKFRKVEQ
jgi:hypothetical protein